jgi:cell division protein FtsX
MILARLVAHVVGPFAAGAALLALTGAGLGWLLAAIVGLIVTYAALWVDHLESETLRKVMIGKPAGQ